MLKKDKNVDERKVPVRFRSGCYLEEGEIAEKGETLDLRYGLAAFLVGQGRCAFVDPHELPPPRPKRERATTGGERETATSSD